MVLKKHNIYSVSEDIYQYNYCNINLNSIDVFVGHKIDMFIYNNINKGFIDLMNMIDELRWDILDIV